MRKADPKPAAKPEQKMVPRPQGLPKSFATAMSAMADLCYDYEKMALGVEIKKQVQKRNEVKAKVAPNNTVVSNKTSINDKPTTFTHKQQPQLVLRKDTSKAGGEYIYLLKTILMEAKKLSDQILAFSEPRICKTDPPYEGDQCSAEQMVENPAIEFVYQGDQVRQGELGDCYLISAISCLVNIGNVLNNCIEYMSPQEVAEAKSFSLRLFDSGRCVQIQTSNSFPSTREWYPVYAQPVENDISVMLLEKAYAQMYGGYNKLYMGHSCDALRDLSGAPTEYIDLNDQESFAKKILKCFEKDYVLTASSKAETSKEFIVPQHSYSVHGYKLVKKGEESILLLKLKNPGGKAPKAFPQLTEFKKQIGEDLSQPNGIFWIPFSRIRANFEVMTSCMIHPKYFYGYHCFSLDELSKDYSGVLMLECPVQMHGYISLNQYHSRHLQGSDYKYELGKIIVCKVVDQEGGYKFLETVAGGFNCKQNMSVEVSLQPGKYMVYAQLNSVSKLIPNDQIFTVSFYTSYDRYHLYKCAAAAPVDPQPILISYIKSHEKEMSVNRSDKSVRCFGTVLGYVCIFYENLSNKILQEDLEFEVVENVDVEERHVEVPPFGAKLLKYRIGRENNCSHKCKFKSVTRFK